MTSRAKLEKADLLYPLSRFYSQAELVLPAVAQIDGQIMPEPYKGLLVHEKDMTSTLERHYQQSIHLRVLQRTLQGGLYSRLVVLVSDRDERAVEFGAIEIRLQHFHPEARQMILEGKRPLGAILYEQGITYSSRPAAFLQIAADSYMKRILGLADATRLFGRRNVLLGSSTEVLAHILEVLPPSGIQTATDSH